MESWFYCGLHAETQDGFSALICAAQNGHSDCVRLLVEVGADKEAKKNVSYAACFISLECVWCSKLYAYLFSSFFSYVAQLSAACFRCFCFT
jgi:hypothetical protein